MSVTVALSLESLTVRVGLIAALAIVALLLTGWRKPARAESRSPRGVLRRSSSAVLVEHLDAPQYKRPGPIRRVLALAASGGIGVLTGVLSAIVIAFGIAWAVIWLSGLLTK